MCSFSRLIHLGSHSWIGTFPCVVACPWWTYCHCSVLEVEIRFSIYRFPSMDLFCGFKVFIVFITCLFKQKIALDNYSWLHRRFIGEHGKPTLGGCGWRQGSLTLSFMCYFFYDWAYDYDSHVPFGDVSPSDHPLQFYKSGLPNMWKKYLIHLAKVSAGYFWEILDFKWLVTEK